MASRKRKQFCLAAAATCGLIVYIGFVEVTSDIGRRARETVENLGKHIQLIPLNMSQEFAERQTMKVVIILSSQRSGSSFVGDFFANNRNMFYSFEPLHPYGTSCTNLREEKLRALKNIFRCDFSSLISDYRNAYISSGAAHDECLRNHVCFLHKQKATLRKYFKLCEAQRLFRQEGSDKRRERTSCGGNPVDLQLWTILCRSSRILVSKILRVCSVEVLEEINEYLANLGSKLYIIELVRDPRGIINSALKLELKRSRLNERLDKVCGQFDENFVYSKAQKNLKGHGIVSAHRHMRVRFEDIAENPLRAVEKIYHFIGEPVPVEVKLWITKSTFGSSPVIQQLERKLRGEDMLPEEMIRLRKEITQITKDGNSPYGTTRNSSNIPLKWRKTLSIETVRHIQKKCASAMERLGYRMLLTEEDKENLTIKLW